ncbi:hypothetical protein D3C73_1140480 [compost metagenome]
MLAGDFRQLPTVHARQSDIGHQQVNAHIRLQQRQGGLGVFGFMGVITQLLQQIEHQHAHRGIVLHQHHGFAGNRRGCCTAERQQGFFRLRVMQSR